MLQQTRVETVIPYYEQWLKRFPNVRILASASEREVLTAWEGLGYYARARNLRKAAKIIRDRCGGRVPRDLAMLRSLPGVGEYTAGAIVSIAFGVDAPALDANIRRVLARVFDVSAPADSPAGKRRLWELAREHLPTGRAADYNQALMDLGATVCLPRRPNCHACPLRRICAARKLGTVARRPVLRPKKAVPEHLIGAAVVVRRGRVIIAKRTAPGLLGGLWEFPNVRLGQADRAPSRGRLGLARAIRRMYGLEIRPNGSHWTVRHAYSHFRVQVEARACQLLSSSPARGVRWVSISDLGRFPMGKVDRQIALRLRRQTLDGMTSTDTIKKVAKSSGRA